MKRIIILFFAIVSAFVISSCCEGEVSDLTPPKVYEVNFTPTTAKVGDVIKVTYETDDWIPVEGINLNTDYEITDKGEIKYIGNYGEIAMNYPDEESRIVKYTLAISPQKTGELIYVTKFVSISEVDSSVSGRKIVTVEFKVPENAKSGFLKVRGDIVSFLPSGFSDEKLIIVDENGNEITE
jgi:hypothetical protein